MNGWRWFIPGESHKQEKDEMRFKLVLYNMVLKFVFDIETL